VIEGCARPGRGRVALRAIGREPRLLMVRIGRAVVQHNMASAAVGRGVRERPIGMALAALHGRVRARQSERRL
jgi:hypothetical protein